MWQPDHKGTAFDISRSHPDAHVRAEMLLGEGRGARSIPERAGSGQRPYSRYGNERGTLGATPLNKARRALAPRAARARDGYKAASITVPHDFSDMTRLPTPRPSGRRDVGAGVGMQTQCTNTTPTQINSQATPTDIAPSPARRPPHRPPPPTRRLTRRPLSHSTRSSPIHLTYFEV